VDCRRLVVATGVNVAPDADMTRRMLTCRLDPRVERAEAREFKRPNLWQEFSRARAAVLSDLYTITAAYLAQEERVSVRPLAGYEHFLRWVAEPLCWLGQPDVIERAREGAANDTLSALIARLLPLIQCLHTSSQHARAAGVTTHDMAMQGGAHNDAWYRLREELHSVLGEATGAKVFNEEVQLNYVHIGRWLLRIAQRVVDGKRLVKAGMKHGQVMWKVETMATMTANGGDAS
jgi:putative DNA primase/helicase